jgi:hypothetical protein
MAVEDAVPAQFAADIPASAKPTFERLRRTRHSAQYFDPSAARITSSDASWAIEKATAALSGVKALLQRGCRSGSASHLAAGPGASAGL